MALTALLLAAAGISFYARSALVDEREFSARAASALDDPDVRAVLADRVAGRLTRGVLPDAQALRPLLVRALAAAADTGLFRRIFTEAVRDRHRALIDGETTFSFQLPVGEGLLFEGLSRVAPRAAAAIPPDLRVPVLRLDPRNFELSAARALAGYAGWRWPLLIAALLSAAGCALLAGGVRSALVHLGVAAAGAGLIVAGVVAGLGEYVVAQAAQAADLTESTEREAVRALWRALFSDLLTAAPGGDPGRSGDRGAGVEGASRFRPLGGVGAGAPGGRRGRASARSARAAILIAVGAAIIFEPALLGRIVVLAAGLLIVAIGVAQLAGLAPANRAAPTGESGGDVGLLLLAGAVVAVLAATALALVVVLPVAAGGSGRERRARGSLQRLAGALRTASRRGRLPRHPQLVRRVGGARLVLHQASATGSSASCATESAPS